MSQWDSTGPIDNKHVRSSVSAVDQIYRTTFVADFVPDDDIRILDLERSTIYAATHFSRHIDANLTLKLENKTNIGQASVSALAKTTYITSCLSQN